MSLLWWNNYQDEDWVFLLMGVLNTFDEENVMAMLWAVRFEWSSGKQFTFSCYRHWVTLVVHDVYGSVHFLYIKEFVTHGGPLSMIAYGIGILLLIRDLCDTHLQIMQPWYVDDAGLGGKFKALQEHMWDMLVRGATWGYLPEPTKIILVVSLRNVQRAEAHFRGMEVCVVAGSRDLIGFIGDPDSYKAWIYEKVTGWTDSVGVLARVDRIHL